MRQDLFLTFILCLCFAPVSVANNIQSSIERMDADSALGKPRVAHVIVALCDNEYQGIVPAPKAIGNGDDPHNNLY
jgi:hypothetical protein